MNKKEKALNPRKYMEKALEVMQDSLHEPIDNKVSVKKHRHQHRNGVYVLCSM